MRDSVIVTNKLRLALGTLVALSLAFAIFCSRQNTATTSFADDESAPTNSVPADILQLFQREANSPPWNQDSPTKTQAILQQCATLQQLLASNAPDDTLSNALAASTLRVSVFMTFGQTLSATGDTHHAEMFFTSVVNDHPARATTKQLARCDLWLAKLFQADALAAKYQQANPAAAGALFGEEGHREEGQRLILDIYGVI